MEKSNGEGLSATTKLLLQRADHEIVLPTHDQSLTLNASGYLSADCAFAFFPEDGFVDTKKWRVVETDTGKPAGEFVLGDLWAEDHSAGKPRTAVGFKEHFMGSHLLACNLDSGEPLWNAALKWDFWEADPNGRYLVFLEEQASDLVVVDLQSTNPPRRLGVPALRDLIPLIPGGEFKFRGDSPVLEYQGAGRQLAFDLQKMEMAASPPPVGFPSPAVRTASVFTFAGAKAAAPTAGIRATALGDGSIEMANINDGKPLARLVFGGKSGEHADYLVARPDGYYASSPGAAGLACHRSGLSVVTFDQFDLTHNRPDLVLSGLGLAGAREVEFYNTIYNRRLARAGAGEVAKETAEADRPILDVHPQSCPGTTESFSLSMRVGISAGRQAVTSLVVAMNDRWLSTRGPANPIQVPPGGHVETTLVLPLGEGNNLVDLWAVDADGVPSAHRRVIVTRTSPPPRRTLYVITAGVSQYKDTNFNLRYAAKDAQDTCDFWNRRGRFAGFGRPASWTKRDEQYGFDGIQSLVLTNELVTRESLEKAGGLIAQAGVDDRVIIAFSGHGLRDTSGLYYFATDDIDFAQPQARGFSERDLESLLAKSGARENLLLLDTCDSGEAEPDLAETRTTVGNVVVSARASGNGNQRGITLAPRNDSGRPVPSEEIFQDLRTGAGGGVIAASGAMDFALEDDQWKNGVFTYALLEGLQDGKADLNRDTRVSFSELCQYMEATVSRLTQGRQHPAIRKNPLAHDLVVLQYPTAPFSIAPKEPDGP